MAAAASIGNATVTLDIINNIVRKTSAKYNWDKRDSTYKTFLKHLKNYAEEAEVSLEDMATSSIAYARNIDYSSIPTFEWWNVPELNQRFQNIPYIIHVSDDNITTVIIKSGNTNCPLKEITFEMMQMLGYLGIIRVYVKGELTIPYWPDNIVHIEINNKNVISYLDEKQIPFPKYLQEMDDRTIFEGTYTNWLPPTLTKLVCACTYLQNLSQNLKEFTYTGRDTDAVITQCQSLPMGMKKVIYTHLSQDLNISEIIMPPGTQFLMLGVNRIHCSQLCIQNVKELFIRSGHFSAFHYKIKVDGSFECYLVKQNVEIILEEGLEHLIIDIENTEIEFLTCIKHVPTSLKKVSIRDCIRMVNVNGFININIIEYTDVKLNEKQSRILKDFESRFPHISVTTT